jgi:chemotaxis methyl-accepting protein methylase
MTQSVPSVESSFDAVARLLARRVGHHLDATRRSRLSRAAAEEAARLGLAMHDYVGVLEVDPEVLQSLLNRVTVQETSFFRDANQFEALARRVLPDLPRPVTIWSAGCSNGQEPYSVAMLLTEMGDLRSRVIATDISTKALERARRGRYSAREIGDLGSRRERFFTPVGNEFQVIPEVRARIEFSAHNLFSEPPPFAPGTCPIVMCRNVLIYFGRDEVISFVERVADWLPPGGWLFLGYSESLWQLTERFQLVRLDEAFVYRRSDGPAAASAPQARSVRRKATERRVPPARVRTETRAARRVRAAPPESRPIEAMAIEVTAPEQTDDPAAAIVAFRRLVYLDPDQPVAHLHLGLALEAAGDTRAARRAFAASRAALDRCDAVVLESALEGYGVAELSSLLERKMDVHS